MFNIIQSSKFIQVLNTALLALLAFVLVQFIWLFLASNDSTFRTKIPIQQNDSTADEPQGLALFGQIKQTPNKAVAARPVLSKTKLNLILKGVWLNQKQINQSYVIIELSSKDKIFFINDKISSLATLVEIYANYVVLNRAGQLEALYLRKNNKDKLITSAKKANNNEIVPDLNAQEKQQLNHIRQQLKANPWRLSQILNIKPKYKVGKLTGFEIRPGKERNLFYKLGLEPGDVVHSVNNDVLTLATLNAVLNTVVNNGNIRITFNRSGTSKTLVLKL